MVHPGHPPSAARPASRRPCSSGWSWPMPVSWQEMAGFTPLVLLDEVAAHLDPERRAALYDALEALGAQVWMTGADPQAFDSLRTRADIFAVVPGTISRA